MQSVVRQALEVLRQCLRLHALNGKQDTSSFQGVMLCRGDTQASF